ncbi:hypothetical protein PCL_10172 [Purpureocillium lilacinum]|uniref:Uncharacterized protein n=1 Tax=Purpureocillium lilacinum TaxID=33203 RepID=A0A2U3EF59_PURLI|nr:hypothetical protein PCL_10172 [Purpureocillium lilacinum]
MKIAGILSTAIMALAAIASPVPSPEDSKSPDNKVDSYATRTGWYYIKRDEVDKPNDDKNNVDSYATRTGWYYIKRDEAGKPDDKNNVEPDWLSTTEEADTLEIENDRSMSSDSVEN